MPYRHIDPDPASSPGASAPYNFVALPEQVLLASEALKDEPDAQRLSGEIHVVFEARTPVFVRGPKRAAEDRRPARLRWEPWTVEHEGATHAALPGSAWRGWVRNLCEVLAFARIGPSVSRDTPFYRTVDTRQRIGQEYHQRMIRHGAKPQAGSVRRSADGWVIEPRRMLRVLNHEIADLRPPAPGSTKRVQVTATANGIFVAQIRALGPSEQPIDGWQAGDLVVTGPIPRKKREFVFLDGAAGPELKLPDELVDRFDSEEQRTRLQREWYDNQGRLGPGPAFFVRDDAGGVRFFGRAQMFRLPYDRSPYDLLPEDQQDGGEPDLVERLFGRVDRQRQRKDDGDGAIRGRVQFGMLRSERPVTLAEDNVIIPAILSSPKTTSYQHYLTQPRGSSRDLTTYLAGDGTTIRGTKFYWTPADGTQPKLYDGVPEMGRGEPEDVAAVRRELLAVARRMQRGQEDDGAKKHSQLTLMHPVPAGTTFTGRLAFDRLYPVEVGLLVTALQAGGAWRHRIGGGRPNRLGSMALVSANVYLLDRAERYRTWEANGLSAPKPDTAGHASTLRESFARVALEHAQRSGEPMTAANQGLRSIRRLDALHVLLTARDKIDKVARKLTVDEFRHRPVLPTPHGVLDLLGEPGAIDPATWLDADRPFLPRIGGGGGAGRGNRRERSRGREPRREDPPARERTSSPGTPAGASTPTGRGPRDYPATGATVRCRVSPETTKKGGPKFEIEDYPSSVLGVLHPQAGEGQVPEPGGQIMLRVISGGRNPQLGFPE